MNFGEQKFRRTSWPNSGWITKRLLLNFPLLGFSDR
jgi:hypothetical protein